ncbi:MAG: GlsB/YeaQ/YmgE family stress response membrane protein [Myxococcota bacterium]|jgi:uncharacterized membrane protein YeaQ/YmgE (transglycosylase-associated protein family)|nr:GlsB/YeaQ/YmgE family stress response membrane protein [Deltaproteobacteria bacterium]MCP4241674.1 GlsB/YeaQ/YmgE family stress response membrane protein [bacterium]MDP6075171.1 GlsB/YeaQ/YmgE family stress response membrane protein [Myxococcota bacterium]MDP7075910.1 GlsB/YeaQ/YmgE family stress response membrane protein [Myxococcota bacterium]MDP7298290.1 GlsB/YeaQ/YmgE family stress response membrane protein [Myxococcota bacterium]
MGFIAFLIIGAIAGWLAGTLMRGDGFGLLGNVGVGIVGAFVGGFLFGLVGLDAVGFIGSIISATVGAVFLLWVVDKIRSG